MRNVIEAVKALRKIGWIVESVDGGWIAERKGAYFFYARNEGVLTDRKIIKLAKEALRNYEGKYVKEATHKPYRRKTRQKIKSENFDSISGDLRSHKNNPWNFD